MELEDTFGDIIRKAAAGTRQAPAAVAQAAGLAAQRIADFIADAAKPTEDEARAIARVLRLDPGKLADIAVRDWQPAPMKHDERYDHQINTPHPSNGYFLILKEQRAAAFVDPGGNTGNILSVLQRGPAKLDYLLITHKHADHIDGLPEVRKAFPGARVAVHRADQAALGVQGRDAVVVSDGDSLPFADGNIRVVHTPGHTDGSVCFIYQSSIFTGDTLFAGSVGGCFGDRFGYDDLLGSASSKIFSLPDDTVVLPGHGPPSTIQEERAHNPFF